MIEINFDKTILNNINHMILTFIKNCLYSFRHDVDMWIFGGYATYLSQITNEYTDIDIVFLNKKRIFTINNVIDIINNTFEIDVHTHINPVINNCQQISYSNTKQPFKLDIIFEHEKSLEKFINDSTFNINKFGLNIYTKKLYYFNPISINTWVDIILDLNKNKSKNIKRYDKYIKRIKFFN